MFSLIKKVLILVLMSSNLGSNIIKSITGNFIKLSPKHFMRSQPNCLLLNNQECAVKKVIIDNDYMTFPCKIKVDQCVGICNDKDNPYFKVCTADIVKNISVNVFDLISRKNVLKNVRFHESCKCDCLLDEKVCNNKQKWNKDKSRCECLEIKEGDNNSFWNVVKCRCEF